MTDSKREHLKVRQADSHGETQPDWSLQFKTFDDEEFKAIPWSGGRYFISNYGKVISIREMRPRILIPFSKSSYTKIQLHHSGVSRTYWINRLVYETFVGPLAPGQWLIHKNGITTDNYYKNLEPKKSWEMHEILHPEPPVTRKRWKRYAFIYQFSMEGKFIAEYASIKQAAKKMGLTVKSIRQCLEGTSKTAGGFQWLSDDDPHLKNGIADIPVVPARTERDRDREKVMQPDKADNIPTEEQVTPGESRAVLQFDKQGKFVAEFPSPGAAAKAANLRSTTIEMCLKGETKSAATYQWKLKSDPMFTNGIIDIEPLHIISNYYILPVLQFGMDGNFIRKYQNIKEAAQAVGLTSREIFKCINKKVLSAGGFQWRSIADPAIKKYLAKILPEEEK
jgi:hypothetical protein